MNTAEQKALGLLHGGAPELDGTVTFSNTQPFDFNPDDGITAGEYDFEGTVAHEFSEIMGRTLNAGTSVTDVNGGLDPANYTLLDLYNYSGPGEQPFLPNAGYFSIDGGATNLDNFNILPNGDLGDSANSAGNDSFRAFSDPSVVNAVTPVDLTVMDILGWGLDFGCFQRRRTFCRHRQDRPRLPAVGRRRHALRHHAPSRRPSDRAVGLFAINLHGNDTLTIEGQGATLDLAG